MDFRPDDDQSMIAESIGTALRDLCTPAQLRAMIDSGSDFDAARWSALADLGLGGTLLSEDQGGLGLGEVEFTAIAESCGRVLLPEPLVQSSGIALPLLAELGETGLDALIDGSQHAVLVHPLMPFVPVADRASVIIVADTDGNLSIGAPDAMDLSRQASADPLQPLYRVSATDRARRLPASDHTRAALERAADRGALFAAAQMLGASRTAVTLAVEYAKERQQFGRPIGANQAVKHMLAEVQVGIEFLAPILQGAAALAHRQDGLSRAHVSHARLRAAEVVHHATTTAIQVHGAMGYSWETDVHLYLKRGLILSQAWGGRDYHLARVADRAFGQDIGPGVLVG